MRLHNRQLQPINRGFARILCRTAVCVAIVAVLAMTICSMQLAKSLRDRTAMRSATLYASRLVPGPDGALPRSVGELQSYYPDLVAVAGLDTARNVTTVYPPEPALRNVAVATVAASSWPHRTATNVAGESLFLCGVIAPLVDQCPDASREVVILLECSPLAPDGLAASAK